MAKVKDLKLNRMLDEEELNDSFLNSMILKYNLIKFSELVKFPHNMSLNYTTLFEAVSNKPHISQNFIFEQEEIQSDLVDFVKRNKDELKFILICVILFKKNILKSNLDRYIILPKSFNQYQGSDKQKIKIQSLYKKYMTKSVNSLYKTARI